MKKQGDWHNSLGKKFCSMGTLKYLIEYAIWPVAFWCLRESGGVDPYNDPYILPKCTPVMVPIFNFPLPLKSHRSCEDSLERQAGVSRENLSGLSCVGFRI